MMGSLRDPLTKFGKVSFFFLKLDFEIAGANYKGIVLEPVVEYARKFYNCPTLEFVPLENDGGLGSESSHWDKVFLPNEYMNPAIEYPGIISDFTLVLLNSTGWYQVKFIR